MRVMVSDSFLFSLWQFNVIALSTALTDYDLRDVIYRDILIVGGGASGSYAAVRFQDDFNKSVILVEKSDALGGNTETYHANPRTNSTIEIGVIAFHDMPVVQNFFSRFDIPLAKLTIDFNSVEMIDFRSGHQVPSPVSIQETTAGIARWAKILAQYPSLAEGFVLPTPVPEDLALSFREFVTRHNLSSVVQPAWLIAEGHGDIMALPTLYVMKIFGPQILRSLSTGFLTTRRRNNHELYERVLDTLGRDTNVLLNSSVEFLDRSGSNSYISAVVKTPSGHKLLRVKQCLMAIPPTLDGLTGVDLTHWEQDLFSQFKFSQFYTGVLEGVPLPPNTTIGNFSPDPANYFLPRLPSTYQIDNSFLSTDLTGVKFGSDPNMSMTQAKTQIIAEIKRAFPGSDPRLIELRSHAPFGLHVSSEGIRGGFYQRLNHLQGCQRTFWTSSAWHVHDTSLLWNFTEGVIAKMLEKID